MEKENTKDDEQPVVRKLECIQIAKAPTKTEYKEGEKTNTVLSLEIKEK